MTWVTNECNCILRDAIQILAAHQEKFKLEEQKASALRVCMHCGTLTGPITTCTAGARAVWILCYRRLALRQSHRACHPAAQGRRVVSVWDFCKSAPNIFHLCPPSSLRRTEALVGVRDVAHRPAKDKVKVPVPPERPVLDKIRKVCLFSDDFLSCLTIDCLMIDSNSNKSMS